MVKADLDDVDSLERAFRDAGIIFAATDFYETMRQSDSWDAMNVEYRRGVNIARAALRTSSLEHFIWSTLPSAHRISDKKYFVPHFEAKAKVDDFIKSEPELLRKTTFYWVSFFADNLLKPTFSPNYNQKLDRYLVFLPTSASTKVGFIGDQRINIGVYVSAIISQRSQCLEKYVFGNVETLSLNEYFALWGSITSKKIQLVQVATADYCESFPNYGMEMSSMFHFWNKYGEAAWSAETKILTHQDLGINKDLIGLKESLQSLDSTTVFATA